MARHFILVAALTMLAAAGARADDDGHHPAGLTASDWNGAYVGGHFGAAWGQSDWTANGAGGLLSNSGLLGLGNPFDFSAGTGSYFQGLQAGYNYALPSSVVLGAQADLSFPNLLAGTQTIAAAGADSADYQDKVLRCSMVIGPTSRMVGFFDSSKGTKPQKTPLDGCLSFSDFGFPRRFSPANLPAGLRHRILRGGLYRDAAS
jgi:opacity protein-like surface antigen